MERQQSAVFLHKTTAFGTRRTLDNCGAVSAFGGNAEIDDPVRSDFVL
jgi:hypothetical protein